MTAGSKRRSQSCSRSRRVRGQKQHQRGPKVYSLHAPEVECIGKGKAYRPYEFSVKVSVATTIGHAKGGQFVTHVKVLPGKPYDGHTLATVIPDMEVLVGNAIARILADKDTGATMRHPITSSGSSSPARSECVTPKIKRELRRRAAVEPVIGHLKAEHRMRRNISGSAKETQPTPFSPPPATTSPALFVGSAYCCAKSYRFSLPRFKPFQPEARVLHGRPFRFLA